MAFFQTPILPATVPATTALTLYNNLAGIGVAGGALLVANQLARKEVPVGTLLIAVGLGVAAGVLGAQVIANAALTEQEALALQQGNRVQTRLAF